MTPGRKTIKLARGELHADADLVVTLSYKKGIAFYLPDEGRWVVSFPQQQHERGLTEEEATSRRFKRTVRMFKAARSRLGERKMLTKEGAPSYFIECLLYNVPDGLFKPKLAPTYAGIVDWLSTAKLDGHCSKGRSLSWRVHHRVWADGKKLLYYLSQKSKFRSRLRRRMGFPRNPSSLTRNS